jgi:hypothetical protein
MGSHSLTETFLCRSPAPSLFLMDVPLAREPTVMLMASGKTSLHCPDKRTKIGRQAEAHLPHAVCQEIPALSPRKYGCCDRAREWPWSAPMKEETRNTTKHPKTILPHLFCPFFGLRLLQKRDTITSLLSIFCRIIRYELGRRSSRKTGISRSVFF